MPALIHEIQKCVWQTNFNDGLYDSVKLNVFEIEHRKTESKSCTINDFFKKAEELDNVCKATRGKGDTKFCSIRSHAGELLRSKCWNYKILCFKIKALWYIRKSGKPNPPLSLDNFNFFFLT